MLPSLYADCSSSSYFPVYVLSWHAIPGYQHNIAMDNRTGRGFLRRIRCVAGVVATHPGGLLKLIFLVLCGKEWKEFHMPAEVAPLLILQLQDHNL